MKTIRRSGYALRIEVISQCQKSAATISAYERESNACTIEPKTSGSTDHITAKAIDTFVDPVAQNTEEFVPERRAWIEMVPACAVVSAVVQLHRFEPIGDQRPRVEHVVARGTRRSLGVLGNFGHVDARRDVLDVGHLEFLVFDVVEVVLWTERFRSIVVLAEVLVGAHVGTVLSRDVIGNEVHDHLETMRVRASHELLEFAHAIGYINGQVGIDIVVVFDSVR